MASLRPRCPRAEAALRHSSQADTYMAKDWAAELSGQITALLRSQLAWMGVPVYSSGLPAEMKALDYACGPGVVSAV